MKKIIWTLTLLLSTALFAENRVINLVVDYKPVHFAGKTLNALAVNDQIPAPTLHFKEGDHVTINVKNHLNEETALHWHGLLVPWQMDGVLGISQKGIPPKGVFQYQFILKQAGTYWYHSHAGLQEQQGLYGAIIVDPPKPPAYHYTKDYVIVLSDWSNTAPDQILANLKKSGDYYAPRMPLQPSLMKFIHDYRLASRREREQLIADYKSMQQMRMSIYDLSDVAYDAFLLNGHSNAAPWMGAVKVGDTVRLRFIGAGSDTTFQVKIPGATLKIVHVEGNDVTPYDVTDFTISPGETYDALVTIQKNQPYIIYAEAYNTAGAAIGALTTAPHQAIDFSQVAQFKEPIPVTREMMNNMMDMTLHPDMDMSHPMTMVMPTEPSIIGDTLSRPVAAPRAMSPDMPVAHHPMAMDTITPTPAAKTLGTKYQDLQAHVKTNNPDKPIAGTINMELFGYMDHYIWFINGVPEHDAHPIPLEGGKRYRIVFTNNSMMHHPMHIHGHWFLLRNGHGAYDPLLHTIDVPPGATVTADVDADASGQWIFHCHMLYHMMTGLARVFQYSTLIEITQDKAKPDDIVKSTAYINRPIVRVDETRPIDPAMVKHPMAHAHGLWLSNFIDVGADPFHSVQRLTYKGLYGSDYNKLELFTNDAEVRKGTAENADMDIFYWRLISQYWAVKGGANYFYRPATTPYWQPGIGIEGLMPWFIDTDIRGYYHAGSAKLDMELSRDTQITNNFLIRAGVRSILATKTVTTAALGAGLNQMRYSVRPYYRVMPGVTVFTEYEHEQDYGAFRRIQRNAGDATVQNTVTVGMSWLF